MSALTATPAAAAFGLAAKALPAPAVAKAAETENASALKTCLLEMFKSIHAGKLGETEKSCVLADATG